MRRLIPITGLDRATLEKDTRRAGGYLMAHMVHMDSKLYMERWDDKHNFWGVIDDPSRLEDGAYEDDEEQVELLNYIVENNNRLGYAVKVIPTALWNERLEQSKGGHNNG